MASIRLCDSSAIPEGDYRVVDVGPWSLLLARIGGRVHAVENVCGHQSRRMDGGRMLTGNAGEPCFECPHHAICFDLRDGHIVDDAGHLNMEPVRSIPIEERGGAIFADLAE